MSLATHLQVAAYCAGVLLVVGLAVTLLDQRVAGRQQLLFNRPFIDLWQMKEPSSVA